MQICCFI